MRGKPIWYNFMGLKTMEAPRKKRGVCGSLWSVVKYLGKWKQVGGWRLGYLT